MADLSYPEVPKHGRETRTQVLGPPVEPVTSLKHMAGALQEPRASLKPGVSAKQDKEILETLQSSGLATALRPSFHVDSVRR